MERTPTSAPRLRRPQLRSPKAVRIPALLQQQHGMQIAGEEKVRFAVEAEGGVTCSITATMHRLREGPISLCHRHHSPEAAAGPGVVVADSMDAHPSEEVAAVVVVVSTGVSTNSLHGKTLPVYCLYRPLQSDRNIPVATSPPQDWAWHRRHASSSSNVVAGQGRARFLRMRVVAGTVEEEVGGVGGRWFLKARVLKVGCRRRLIPMGKVLKRVRVDTGSSEVILERRWTKGAMIPGEVVVVGREERANEVGGVGGAVDVAVLMVRICICYRGCS
jgi:hypothetical protein